MKPAARCCRALVAMAVVAAVAGICPAGAAFAAAPPAASAHPRPPAATPTRAARLESRDEARLQAELRQARSAPDAGPAPRVVFIGAALDDETSAFAGDVQLAQARLRALAPQLRSLTLANGHGPAAWPRATRRTLREAFADAARLLDAGAPSAHRLAIVLLSSHGARDLLALETPGMRQPSSLTTQQVARLLQPLGDTPTLLVISACHAGSMIPALHAPHRVIFAAARADRSSFGCQPDSHNTYFVEELLGAMRPGRSLRDWFDATAVSVGARERRMDLSPPSLPQLDIGEAMAGAAELPLADLLRSASAVPSR
jgi:hypothetical protein